MRTTSRGTMRWASTSRRRFRLMSALVLLLGLLQAGPARAAVLLVNTTADDDGSSATNCRSGTGICTLRGALAAAQSGETIQFTATGTIQLTHGTLTIGTNISIQGPGAGSLAVSGGNSVGVFSVSSGVQATLAGLTIENGSAIGGGGIVNNGTLTATSSTISNNSAIGGGGILNNGTLTVTNTTISINSAVGGGGILNNGMLTVDNSTISGNSAAGGGGILSNGTMSVTNSTISGNSAPNGTGGGILNNRTLTMTNSTISNNSSLDGTGGGILNNSTLTVTNSTISGNSAAGGGGINNFSGTTVLRNSIVAQSPSGSNCSGTITSTGNNLSDDATCFRSNARQGDQASTNPQLGPLLLNPPGTTATFALQPNSPAIDGVIFHPIDCPPGPGTPTVGPGTPTPITTDQRGVLRPQGSRCDIGAFELEGIPTPTPTSMPTNTATSTRTPTATTTAVPSATATRTPTAPPSSLNVAQAIALVAPSGQTGQPCASAVGQRCAVSGAVTGSGQITGSQTWTLTAPVPAGVAAGVVSVAVFSTPGGMQGFPCAAVAAGAGSVTCSGTTANNALQGSTITVVFAAGLTSTGTVSGPGPQAQPLLPSPPLIVPLPPLPALALLPPIAPPVPAPAAPVAPEVPVIPEAQSLALLAVGLGLLGLRVVWCRRA